MRAATANLQQLNFDYRGGNIISSTSPSLTFVPPVNSSLQSVSRGTFWIHQEGCAADWIRSNSFWSRIEERFVGVDPLQAGNVVQLVIVLGMTVGWISTYMFRVASKDMTYAHQLRDYESKVMEKRLEGLTEAELQVLIEQVEEEKRVAANSEQVN
uniref:Uncharacterized protein n=1 Tax=Chenopodium quinoa TaxID=63459 RepID=A0A803MGB2_CHEQI